MKTLLACFGVFVATLWAPTSVRADGATLVFREQRGDVVVFLLAEPTPLRAGEVGLEVLVQSSETGEPLLSRDVQLRLRAPGEAEPLEISVRAGVAANRLFRTARVDLPVAGSWEVEVRVAGDDGGESFRALLEVGPAQSLVGRHRSMIAATLLGVAILALHQWRSVSRDRARRG